jgi:kynureninase
VLQGIANQLGNDYKLKLAHSKDSMKLSIQELDEIITHDTALVVLSHVAFKSAFMYDMEAVTELAHSRGALMLWDLSHAAGAVQVDLNKSKVDLAVGCTYKYLNGGPGAPAYLYVREGLHEKLTSPVWGWFGKKDPFDFELEFIPAPGIKKFLVGTPPILSQEAIEPGLDIVLEAGMENLRQKSIQQSQYLIFLYKKYLQKLDFSLGSPTDPDCRGSHVSFQHPEAYRICKALIEPHSSRIRVIPDFRAPDNIRIGISPLYTSFMDIWFAVDRLLKIVNNKEYSSFTNKKDQVT